jgi:hypothetical protein
VSPALAARRVLMSARSRAEICTCRVTRPGVARRATSAKGSRRLHRPVSSFARRWITSVRGSTGRGRRSRPLPSASRRPAGRALPLHHPSAAPPRLRCAGKRCAIGRVEASPGNGLALSVQLRLNVRSNANRVGQRHTRLCRHRPGPPHVGARQPRGRRQHSERHVPRVLEPDRQRRGEPPDPASQTRRHRPKLAARCLEYFRRWYT